MKTISCSKCEGSMEEGYLLDVAYGGALDMSWIAGKPQKSFWTGISWRDRERRAVSAFRCEKCGFVESYAIEHRR